MNICSAREKIYKNISAIIVKLIFMQPEIPHGI